MTDLSPAAQAILDAFLDTPAEVPMPMWDYGRDLAAVLRAAAPQMEFVQDHLKLLAISDELEAQ
jgi:hypothetical protein